MSDYGGNNDHRIVGFTDGTDDTSSRCSVCVLLKSINVRREGDHMVARFTDEEWEKIQAVLETLGSGEGE